ncbi:MAG: peptidylprolyl isomerase, partial [Flavobacterium sp.]
MKFIDSRIIFMFFLLLFSSTTIIAQEIIRDTVIVPVKKVKTNQRQKIDGIIATVGDFIILDSDIDKSYLELSSQGNSIKDITRCQMLGKLLEDKLYAHQAIQDSVKVTDAEVKGMMAERLGYMGRQIGSVDKVKKYNKKNTEEELISYFF